MSPKVRGRENPVCVNLTAWAAAHSWERQWLQKTMLLRREADILALRGKTHAPPCAPTKRVNLYRTQGATT